MGSKLPNAPSTTPQVNTNSPRNAKKADIYEKYPTPNTPGK